VGVGTVVTLPKTGTSRPVPIPFTFSGLLGAVNNITLELRGFTHSAPGNLDVLLVSPDGIPVMLMSGAGGSAGTTNIDLVFR
jgi:hypothetical protein